MSQDQSPGHEQGQATWGKNNKANDVHSRMRRFSARAVNNLQIGGALTRIIYNGVLLSKF